jgi:hypothetical protein
MVVGRQHRRSERQRVVHIAAHRHHHLRAHDLLLIAMMAADPAVSHERAGAGGVVEGTADDVVGARRALHHRLLGHDLLKALRHLSLGPLECAAHGEDVLSRRAFQAGVAGLGNRRVERLLPAGLGLQSLGQETLLTAELLEEHRVHRRLTHGGYGGGGAREAVDEGLHGGVPEREQLPAGGERDGGDVRAAEHGEVGGLLEEAVFALGEAHLPLLLAADGLDLGLLPFHRLLPLPVPADALHLLSLGHARHRPRL